ncbi:class I SAM-dependent methyltransferase [Bacteriovoracales bacterium]|nr:class I SAM-dependent methyltransferase [Bacteriovoracales bacterium]
MSQNIKLCLGASPIWYKEGWHVLDHKIEKTTGDKIAGDASKMDLPDNSCEIVFCSHVFEHIPHIKLPMVISEINRVLRPGGIFRMLTPDLEVIAKAYVEKDENFFKAAKSEDVNIRQDLGFGGMFMNFIVSPGQDTILFDRGLNEFIGGYAHLYSYDFEMMRVLFDKLGFTNIVKSPFNGSSIKEMKEPLHIDSLPPVWQDLNDELYNKHGLIHRLVDGKYEINFKITGFDRDPLTSLIVECKKETFVTQNKADELFNYSKKNYNRYAKSLLKDDSVVSKFDDWGIKY